MHVGETIRLARAIKGIKSQAELARRTDLSRGYICQLEASEALGDRKISDVKRICDELGIRLSDLTGEHDERDGAA